ncbi:MAG: NusG domain II-containing protein [Firmicutes bacterium]|nr:NusG domain II-containing protein [Bacillota bacterium]
MIKKADIILLIVILAVGIPLAILSLSSGTGGDKVKISLNGKVYGTYPLHEDRVIEVSEDGHTNHITIKDGQVSMSYSTCRNQVCVNTGAISEIKDAIVCLPNRVVVEIISSVNGKGGDADVISG